MELLSEAPCVIERQLMYKWLLWVILLAVTQCVHASFTKNLWPEWQVNNPLSTNVINHDQWQQFLTHTVITNAEGINLVNYPAMGKEDVELLNNYIRSLCAININNYNRNEQLAFWLNLYNALTVQLIIKHFPLSTIEDINISPGLFSIGPWGAKLIEVNKVPLSLDEIHNRIIRPIWNDVRTHYAINNASIGAPNIGRKAYLGGSINDQLNAAAHDYINSPRGVQIIENQLVVSKVYNWFKEDFGTESRHIIDHLKQFSEQPLQHKLESLLTIENYVYNWHLNSAIG